MDSLTRDPQVVWNEVTERIRGVLPEPAFQFALRSARAVSFENNVLVLAVETDFARTWVIKRHRGLICDALFEVTQRENTTVEVVVESNATTLQDEVSTEPLSPLSNAAFPERPSPTTGTLRSRFTFDNFVTGPSNRFAHAAAMAVAEAPARAYNPLFIYGGVGLGKTHLLHAIGHFIEQTTPELTALYVSLETFTNDFINALRDGEMRSFKDRYRSVDVLLIDDIQALSGREQTQEEFFHTFNSLHDSGKQIIISSDRPPKSIATLEDRLRSRFEMGLITDIQPPDLETRIAILSKRVHFEGVVIPDTDVLHFIAERVSTNVRALEGALNRVVAHASLEKQPITVDLATEILRDVYPPDGGVVTVESVKREVCRYYNVTHDDLVGQKRTREVVTPRQVAMYLTRELTDGMSTPAIGRAFGGRDHSTVLHAVQKVTKQMTGSGDVYNAVKDLTTRLTGSPS